MAKNAFNIVLDKTKFENIKYEQWAKLVQYVLNYDLWLTNIEKLEQLYLNKARLEAFLECRGVIPTQYLEQVRILNEKYEEVKRIRKEIEISDIDSSFKVKNKDQLKLLEKELDLKVINHGAVNEAMKQFVYFQNPYFLNSKDQRFEEREQALRSELKEINWMIKHDLKPKYKKSLRMLKLLEIEFRRILGLQDKNADIKPLFNFVRPYLNEIVVSDSYFYNELLSLALG